MIHSSVSTVTTLLVVGSLPSVKPPTTMIFPSSKVARQWALDTGMSAKYSQQLLMGLYRNNEDMALCFSWPPITTIWPLSETTAEWHDGVFLTNSHTAVCGVFALFCKRLGRCTLYTFEVAICPSSIPPTKYMVSSQMVEFALHNLSGMLCTLHHFLVARSSTSTMSKAVLSGSSPPQTINRSSYTCAVVRDLLVGMAGSSSSHFLAAVL